MGCNSSTAATGKAKGKTPEAKAEGLEKPSLVEPQQGEPQKQPPKEEAEKEASGDKSGEDAGAPDAEAELLFKKYGEQELRVTIIMAKDLRNADFLPGSGKSDPFCVCEVKAKPQLKFQTPVVDDTLSPIWNHEGSFENFSAGDSLVFTVSDKDLLGTATLLRGTFENGFDGDLPFGEKGKESSASLHVRVAPLTPIIPESIEVPILEVPSDSAAPQGHGFLCCCTA